MKYTRNVAINVVIANMIGTGVFTSLGFQVGSIPSWFSIMVLWATGALISLFGAFAYAEISTRISGSGGEYNYLSKIYSNSLGFTAGWVSFIVGFSAPIAAVALAIGSYTTNFIQLSEIWIATLIILIVGFIHILGIKSGSFFQNIITRLKIVLISALILSPFLMVYFSDFNPSTIVFNPLNNGYNDWDLIFSSEFAISLVYVCFSYSGWNASVYFASKIEDPVINIPYSLIIGTLVVSILYLLLNSMFLYSVELSQLKDQIDIGNVVLSSLFPKYASSLSLLFGVALVASLSSMMIAGPSVLEKMGEDYNLLKILSKNNKYQSPHIALISLIILPIIMLNTASFEWIIKYIGVCLSLFSILVVLGVPILRLRDKNEVSLDIYKAPFGKIISFLFSIINIWMIYHLVSSDIWILAGVSVTLLSGFIVFKIITERTTKLADNHYQAIVDRYCLFLRVHPWDYATSPDSSRKKKGEKSMERIRNIIGWIQGENLDVKKELEHFWKQYASKEFKNKFPKNLKKGTEPSWAKAILRTKPKSTFDPNSLPPGAFM